jgi:hypothetical protein
VWRGRLLLLTERGVGIDKHPERRAEVIGQGCCRAPRSRVYG